MGRTYTVSQTCRANDVILADNENKTRLYQDQGRRNWYYPLDKPHFLGGRSSGAIRKGDWKLIEFFDTGQKELYNLADDISEKNNLAGTNPEEVAELQKLLNAWRKEVGAKIPEGRSG